MLIQPLYSTGTIGAKGMTYAAQSGRLKRFTLAVVFLAGNWSLTLFAQNNLPALIKRLQPAVVTNRAEKLFGIMRLWTFKYCLLVTSLFALIGFGSVTLEAQSLVPPSINSIFPSAGAVGTSFTVIVTGTNLASVTGASFSGTGVTASLTGNASTTTLSLFVTISAAAPTGTRTLTLSAPAGDTPVNFVITAGGSWSGTGSMEARRRNHTATSLSNGRVLVVGGVVGGSGTNSAEVYEPVAGTWTATATPLAPRSYHTATLLPSGKVLVVGGYEGPQCDSPPLRSAELFDPNTGTWSSAGFLRDARAGHTATLLNDGTVLVVGGQTGCSGALSSAEIYNPATGVWVTTGAMSMTRERFAATLLNSGKVLVTDRKSVV